MSDSKFWENTKLLDMNHQQWESICDGCAKCCLQQLEDTETGQLVFTDVACDLLDQKSCRCTDYENRSHRVPTCMTMTPENVEQCAEYAPPSCAYRLLLEGNDLPEWHHLKTQDSSTIHKVGQSVAGRVRSAATVDPDLLENYVVDWP